MINLGENMDYMTWVCDNIKQKLPRLQLYDKLRGKERLYEVGM